MNYSLNTTRCFGNRRVNEILKHVVWKENSSTNQIIVILAASIEV